MANKWREKVDSTLKKHLETMIYESSKQKEAYKLAPKPETAQLWVAIADLSKQMINLSLKLNYLERALTEIARSKKAVEKKVIRKVRKPVEKKTARKNTRRKSSLIKSLKKY